MRCFFIYRILMMEEPPSKLMAMNSRDSKISDRFSDLPDETIQHIFSFLKENNNSLRFSILSKRIGQLCISSPHLSFRCHDDPKYNKCTEKCKRFSTYLNDFFRACDGHTTKLCSLDLSWTCMEYDSEDLFNSWISIAVRSKVEELNLGIGIRSYGASDYYVLPACIFECPSLRVLKLSSRGNRLLKLPSTDFSSLQVLSLNYFQIMDDYLGEWISTYCKSLRKLSLYELYKVKKLCIVSSSLEELSMKGGFDDDLECLCIVADKLHTLAIDSTSLWVSTKERLTPIVIVARNLQNFTWEGKLVGRFSGNFVALQNAKLFCETQESNSIEIKKNLDSHSLVEILQNVSHTRILQLPEWVIEGLFARDCLPILLENVHKLVVHVKCLRDGELTPAIVSFLRGFPNLTAVNISCKDDVLDLSIQFIEMMSKKPINTIDYWMSLKTLFPKRTAKESGDKYS